MSATVLDQIKEALLSFVEERDFEVVDESYSPEAFGNAVVNLQSKDFAVRVVRDRDQIFADVGPAQTFDEWHDLSRVLEFLGHGRADTSAFELDQLASTLKAHYNELKNLFSKNSYPSISKQLTQFEKEKTRERLAMLGSRSA
jgi:hypothetical protein